MSTFDTSSGDENPPPRRRWIVAAAAGGILLLLGGLAVLSLPPRVFEPDPAAVLLDEVRQSPPQTRAARLLDEARMNDEPSWFVAWLHGLLDISPPKTRGPWEIAEDLENLGTEAVPPLIAALNGSSKRVRQMAAETLGLIGDPRAAGPMAEALKDDFLWVRTNAAEALGRIEDRSAIPALVAALGDPMPEVRRAAARALGVLGGSDAVPALLLAMKDADSSVRVAAAGALAAIGDPRALPVLIEDLARDEPQVAEAAAEALAVLADPQAAAPLTAALNSRWVHVRRWAAEGLGALGNPDCRGDAVATPAAAALRPLLDSQMHEYARASAGLALGLLRREEAVDTLSQLALEKDGWGWIPFAAVAGLARIGTPGATAALHTAAARSPLPWIRRFAQRAADAGLVPALIAEMQTSGKKGEAFPHYAAQLLFYLNDPAAAPALKEARQSKDPEVRLWARRALARLERREVRREVRLEPRPEPRSEVRSNARLEPRP